MPVKDENKRISLTLSKELDEKIDRLAGLQNASKNSVIVNLIEMSIDMQIDFWNKMKDPQMMGKLMELAVNLGEKENSQGYQALTKLGEMFNSDDPKTKKAIDQYDQALNKIKK